jgi:hypothetical protein
VLEFSTTMALNRGEKDNAQPEWALSALWELRFRASLTDNT